MHEIMKFLMKAWNNAEDNERALMWKAVGELWDS
jgi:hypothetical protein